MDKHCEVSDIVSHNSRVYCEEIIINLFPSPIDGLIVSKRRILQTQDPKRTVPAAELVGNTRKLHHHSDAAIYDTATNMCDKFKCAIPLLQLIGGGNGYFNEKAAASRYTNLKLSDVCRDLFIKGINRKTLPTRISDDLTGRELVHYVPKLPTALLIPVVSIGYGFSSKSIPLGIKEVCDLVSYYIRNKKLMGDCNYSRVIDKFLPRFPILCNLCNRKELLYQYRQGNFKAAPITEGYYELKNDKLVLIRTIAYGESATSVYENFIKLMAVKDHWVSKEDLRIFTTSTDSDYCDFEIILSRNKRNIFATIEKLKTILKLRKPIHPQPNYTIENSMVPIDYPGIVKLWYDERYKSIMNSKRYRQQQLYRKISELEVYILICDKKDQVIELMKTVSSKTDLQDKFRKAFDFTLRQCEILAGANLRTLSIYKAEELHKQIASLTKEMDDVIASFDRIDEEILDDMVRFKKTYSNAVGYSSSFYAWKGCVHVHGMGFALFETEDRMLQLVDMFRKKTKTIHMFNNANTITFKLMNKVIISADEVSALSPTYHANELILDIPHKQLVSFNGKRWFTKYECSRQMMYVSSTPMGVSLSKGIVPLASLDDLFTRKKQSPIRYVFDNINDATEFIVVSISSANWKELTIQKAKLGSRIISNPAGHEYILAVVGKDTDSIDFNLPMHPKWNYCSVPNLNKLCRDKINHHTFRKIKYKY